MIISPLVDLPTRLRSARSFWIFSQMPQVFSKTTEVFAGTPSGGPLACALNNHCVQPGGADLVLTEDERQQFVAEFLTELEQEHERREENAQTRKAQQGSRRTEAFKRQEEEADLRNNLRRKFYTENGYKQTVDRTGRQIWLSPSEYEARTRTRRKKRKKTRIKPKRKAGLQDIMLFALMCASAVLIGLMLVR